MIRVCSGFSPAGYEIYGKNFLETFDKFWPKGIDLRVYVESPLPVTQQAYRDCIKYVSECEGLLEFIERHSDSLEANGKLQSIRTCNWKPKNTARGYDYRYDAVKFSRQCFIPEAALVGMDDGDILVWLDADVLTFKQVPEDFIENLLGENDMAYLGRGAHHSEIGFWAVRIGEQSRKFVRLLANVYRTDDVFNFQEWHSAFIWDSCRLGMGDRLKVRNLTPKGSGHVWFQSPLSRYMDHLKGNRKVVGRSAERKD